MQSVLLDPSHQSRPSTFRDWHSCGGRLTPEIAEPLLLEPGKEDSFLVSWICQEFPEERLVFKEAAERVLCDAGRPDDDRTRAFGRWKSNGGELEDKVISDILAEPDSKLRQAVQAYIERVREWQARSVEVRSQRVRLVDRLHGLFKSILG